MLGFEEGDDEGTLLGIELHVSQIVGQTSFAGFSEPLRPTFDDLHVIRITFAVACVFNQLQVFFTKTPFLFL